MIEAELEAARAAGARLLCLGSADSPAALAGLEDAPPLLWSRGDPGILRRDCLALVGARNASSLGVRMARALSADLGAQGFTIVSGLARGIDAAAHDAALPTGTAAVMAGGVDVIYPPEHARLAQDIAARGVLLSEQPMGLQPQARHFPRRNRLVAGLSRGVVVVEAAPKSGSLITARDAADLGREVLAVPGHPFDGRAAGCNLLIRDGAHLVRNATDVTAALETAQPAPRPAPPPAPAPPRMAVPAATKALHRRILDRLGPSPLGEDQLIRDLGAPAQAVGALLVELELDGRIQRQPGGLLSRLN